MILIQCTNSKRDRPAQAKHLYDTSTYFCKMRDYAEATGDQWYILSAKHGLLSPTAEIDPYDEYGLSEQQAKTIAAEISRSETEYVEIIAGSAYTDVLTPELESHGIEVKERCRGLKIGERMQKLDNLTRSLTHKTL